MSNFGVYRHGLGMGRNDFLMKTSHTFSTWLGIYDEKKARGVSTVRPEKPGAVPLYHAARFGFRYLATHLIAENPEHVNARENWEDTAMYAAMEGGNTNILSLLLEHDTDVDSRDRTGATSLHWASNLGKLSAGQYLLDHGADINARGSRMG
ncbi:Ankyrin repeat-containing domain protein [Russula decolorans]|jgi:ankyrin repeat protein